jgi:hypothetical protein
LHWEEEPCGKIRSICVFIIKDHFFIKEISKKAEELFKCEFIPKQFVAQLGYFKGINYEEEVTYLIPNPPS